MIKNVVFDIGNVLIDFSWRECAARAGVKNENFERVADATVRSKWWGELDRGVLTDDQILENMISSAPDLKDEISRFFANVSDILTPFDYSENWLASLRARGYGVYILSNFSEVNFNKNLPRYTFLNQANGRIISYLYKCIKPEKELYERLLSEYKLKADECVFIDDREDNISAARSLGFYGIVFTSYEDARGKLEALLRESGAYL